MALSTSEADYVALSTKAREGIWIKFRGNSVGWNMSGPMKLHGDIQTSEQMAQETRLTEFSKHNSISYHFIRGAIGDGVICLRYPTSVDNIADILTKGL